MEVDQKQYYHSDLWRITRFKARQIIWMAEEGIAVPSISGAGGRGSARIYSWEDTAFIFLLDALMNDLGLSYKQIRKMAPDLRKRMPELIKAGKYRYVVKGIEVQVDMNEVLSEMV